MASTYTSNDGFEKIEIGSQANTWGSSLNNDFDLVDQACDGSVIISISTASFSLNVADGALSNGRNKVVEFTGSPASPVTVSVVPVNISKVYWISNQTGQPMTVNNGAGSALSVPFGACMPCFCDGSGNVTSLSSGIVSDTVNTNNLVVNTSASLPSGPAVLIAGQGLDAYISSLIPSLTMIPGTLIIPNLAAVGVPGGSWIIFTFGTVVGTRIRIAYGSGLLPDGSTITLPGGFPTDGSNQQIGVAISSFNATAGQITGISVAYNAATQQVTAPTKTQSGGGAPGVNIAWSGTAWLTGY